MSRALTLESPFAQRFLAWINERFPWGNALLFFILYLTAAVVGRATLTDAPIRLTGFDLWGCLVTWSLFLVIRIFDEHKDYEKDLHNHPQRVLQSGLISLHHLRVAAAVAVAVQLITAIGLDGGLGWVTLAWAAMFLWLCLMGREFFCGVWLEQHLSLYAFSHMLIMPLIVAWLVKMGCPEAVMGPAVWTLMALAFVSGFAFEITRKTRGPEEERETVDSYARIFGIPGAVAIISLLVVGMIGLQGGLLVELGAGHLWPAWLVLAAALLLALRSLRAFLLAPSLKGREKNELAVGLGTLIGYLVLIVATLSLRGVSWSWWV